MPHHYDTVPQKVWRRAMVERKYNKDGGPVGRKRKVAVKANGPSDAEMEEVFRNPNKAYNRPNIKASKGFNRMMAQKAVRR